MPMGQSIWIGGFTTDLARLSTVIRHTKLPTLRILFETGVKLDLDMVSRLIGGTIMAVLMWARHHFLWWPKALSRFSDRGDANYYFYLVQHFCWLGLKSYYSQIWWD